MELRSVTGHTESVRYSGWYIGCQGTRENEIPERGGKVKSLDEGPGVRPEVETGLDEVKSLEFMVNWKGTPDREQIIRVRY